MGYTIKKITINQSDMSVDAEFTNGKNGSVSFPLGTSVADIKTKLDTIDAAWPTEQSIKDALPAEYKDLVGYTKA